MSTATTEKTATEVEEHLGYAPAAVWPVYRKWRQHEEWLEELIEMLERHGVRVQVVPGGVG